MHELPRPARAYVGSVIATGLILFVVCLPEARFAQPLLFIALLRSRYRLATLRDWVADREAERA